MSEFVQALILALVQGLTEFLPVSSSAHLILPSRLLGWADQGLAFDVAVHVGSLLAVILYFRRDLLALAMGSWSWLLRREEKQQAQMVLWLMLATLPVGLAGVLLDDFVEQKLRSLAVIATSTLVFGILLGLADRRRGGVSGLNLKIALWIGLAQVLAIIPGTSRSGVTMTAGLLCGLQRDAAARFSFLLSIPVISAAGLLKGHELYSSSEAVPWAELLTAMVVSALTAYLCIHWFLRLLDRIGFMPFVIYRVILSAILFWILWGVPS